MYQLKYKIKTLAPVVIPTTYGEINTVNTESFIPGTTALGMIAWRYLKQVKSTDAPFYRLFPGGRITFTNAYLTGKNRYEEDVVFYPSPLSWQEGKADEKIYDLLFVADDFDRQTRAMAQFVTWEELRKAQVALELHHHHKRDPVTGTPAEGLLFTYEAISSDQIFSGKLVGEESDLRTLLSICREKWIGQIGRSKCAQYWEVEFLFESIEPVETGPSLDEGMKQVVLTMLSHTLIYNNYGFPSTQKDDLEGYLHGAKVQRATLKSKTVENFVGVWRFKKPAETGFMAGSCFLLDTTGANKEKLFDLQVTGLGERKHEGFGRIQLDFVDNKEGPFDLEPAEESDVQKPGMPVSERAGKIVQEIIDEAIGNRICLLAAEESERFRKLPTGSLIKRLENILKGRKNQIDKFREDINNLKCSAAGQMERCDNGKITLKSFFQKDGNQIVSILNRRDMGNIQAICNEIGYQPELPVDEITYLYFNAFLSHMRKRKKYTQEEK